MLSSHLQMLLNHTTGVLDTLNADRIFGDMVSYNAFEIFRLKLTEHSAPELH